MRDLYWPVLLSIPGAVADLGLIACGWFNHTWMSPRKRHRSRRGNPAFCSMTWRERMVQHSELGARCNEMGFSLSFQIAWSPKSGLRRTSIRALPSELRALPNIVDVKKTRGEHNPFPGEDAFAAFRTIPWSQTRGHVMPSVINGKLQRFAYRLPDSYSQKK
ncbi:hypothetical protein BU24DRAFT_90612 [Aaosphaeria arxii CBS 175.79]|uniref:Uncharacterized protein n=1 Tax=Aaosphaeria arxii CBS 175.79 TaxID=1450172 RepID=A0A6A5X868_9PLEO|nr:uncharacterized protein BU24DRAFT_90612 [Aaosphaeria arxii CBS 175.79]KAF2009089.1 hypothetical protein BU24DRAFT_90612 [Aaosphaeria arxii CBS 175.79]